MTFLEALTELESRNPFELACDYCPRDYFALADDHTDCPLSIGGDWTPEQHRICVQCWQREKQ